MIQPFEQVDLQPLNTMAVPAVADYYYAAESDEEIQAALAWAKRNKQQVLVLSGGSNIVLKGDFHGLCLHIKKRGITFTKDDESYLVTAAAGENWHDFVQLCLDKTAFGLENLALIPGCVGAAPVQNIGAYGVEVKDFIVSLEAINRDTGTPRTFLNNECEFAYRESIFKSQECDQYIITSVTFALPSTPKINLSYRALADTLASCPQPTPYDVFSAVVCLREAKLPNPSIIANTGSFFKNPTVSKAEFLALKEKHAAIVGFPDGDNVKVAAGWLIDNAGWKGKEVEGVKVHDKQALVLTNPGQSGGESVLRLAETIQADIYTRYKIALEIEPRIY